MQYHPLKAIFHTLCNPLSCMVCVCVCECVSLLSRDRAISERAMRETQALAGPREGRPQLRPNYANGGRV